MFANDVIWNHGFDHADPFTTQLYLVNSYIHGRWCVRSLKLRNARTAIQTNRPSNVSTTMASIRAVRNAIDSNSVEVQTIVPDGYDNLKIHLQLGIPREGMYSFSGELSDCGLLDLGVVLKECHTAR